MSSSSSWEFSIVMLTSGDLDDTMEVCCFAVVVKAWFQSDQDKLNLFNYGAGGLRRSVMIELTVNQTKRTWNEKKNELVSTSKITKNIPHLEDPTQPPKPSICTQYRQLSPWLRCTIRFFDLFSHREKNIVNNGRKPEALLGKLCSAEAQLGSHVS